MAPKAENPPIKCVFIGQKDSDKDKIIEYYQPVPELGSGKQIHTLSLVDEESECD